MPTLPITMATHQGLFLSLNADHKGPISNTDKVQAADIYIVLLIFKTYSDIVFKKDAFLVCLHPTYTQPFSILKYCSCKSVSFKSVILKSITKAGLVISCSRYFEKPTYN